MVDKLTPAEERDIKRRMLLCDTAFAGLSPESAIALLVSTAYAVFIRIEPRNFRVVMILSFFEGLKVHLKKLM